MHLARNRFVVTIGTALLLGACADSTAPESPLPVTDQAAAPAARVDSTNTPGTPRSMPALDAAFGGRYHAISSIAADGSGRIHMVVLDRGAGGGVTATRVVYTSYENGTWSAPVDVTSGGGQVARATVAADGAGNVHFFWLQNTGNPDRSKLTDVMHRSLSAGTWSGIQSLYHEVSRSKAISTPILDAGTDAEGRVFLVHYAEGPNNGARGLVTRVQQGSGFVEAPDIEQGADDLRLAAVGNGMEVIATSFEVTDEYVEGEPYSPDRSIVLRTVDGTGSSAKSIIVQTKQDESFPGLAFVIDPKGVRHVLYAHRPADPTGQAYARLRYQSSADGRTWSAPVDLGIAPDYFDEALQMTIDGAGRVHVVYFAPDQNSLAHRVLQNGTWSAASTITRSTHVQFGLTTSAGEAMVVWRSGGGYRFTTID